MWPFPKKKCPKIWALRVVRREAVESLWLGAYVIQHYDPFYRWNWHDCQGRYRTENEAYEVAMSMAKMRDQMKSPAVPVSDTTF